MTSTANHKLYELSGPLLAKTVLVKDILHRAGWFF